MASKFGKHQYPVLGAKSNDRERLLFVAAAGLAFSLLIILVVLFNFKDPANAGVQAASAPPEIPTAVGTITLLTPDRSIKAGTPLADVQFKEVYWPRNQVPDGAVRDTAELKNMYAKVELEAGVPMQRKHITSEQSNIALPLTPGNRAVAIQINDETSVEQHTRPGTHVDVVLTYYQSGELTSKVIVQNARVLSLGGDTNPMGNLGAMSQGNATLLRNTSSSRTITLDVAPKDALEILTAKKLGDLSLMMRNDNAPMPTVEVRGAELDDKKKSRTSCKRGTVKIQGEEFVMNCDGSMTRMSDPYEP